MPEFDTTGPVDATVEFTVGELRVIAGDRPGTTVEVRPTDASSKLDMQAAEQTRIECTDGRLRVRGPRQKGLGIFGRPGSIDVQVTLATGSRLRAEAGIGAIETTGALGETRLKTGLGTVRVEHAAALEVTAGAGDVEIGMVDGSAEASTGSGELRAGTLRGTATIKSSNGVIRIGSAGAALRASSSNGHVLIGEAAAGVEASTANGDIRVDAARAGGVSLRTAMGGISIGVPAGTAAYLDLHTRFGNVDNRLDASPAPAPGEPTVEVHARTSFGDIVVRRPDREHTS